METPALYGRLADLPLRITGLRLEPMAMTTNGWTRRTTVVVLEGEGTVGAGEDVTYEPGEQGAFQRAASRFELAGRYTFDGFSRALDAVDLHPVPPAREMNTLYRRWAFESAALDLALKQAGVSLADRLGIEPRPVRYVVSTGLGDPPSTAPLERVLASYPEARFKVDLSSSWTSATVASLASLGVIDTVDLKAHYHGSFVGPPPDVAQYRAVAEGLAGVWIEDPAWTGPAWDALAPHRDRVTWDAPLHSLADILQLPAPPRCINIKPSRFGFVAELLRVYEYCGGRGIAMYGGGQFELGPGRGQIQYLASLFHPDTANDVAPAGFNREELTGDLPPSPLAPRPAPAGFGWRD